jgi:hypothetical protein
MPAKRRLLLKRYLMSLTPEQYLRFTNRIWDQIKWQYGGYGGSWDWPTLRVVFPDFCAILKTAFYVGRNRWPSGLPLKPFKK